MIINILLKIVFNVSVNFYNRRILLLLCITVTFAVLNMRWVIREGFGKGGGFFGEGKSLGDVHPSPPRFDSPQFLSFCFHRRWERESLLRNSLICCSVIYVHSPLQPTHTNDGSNKNTVFIIAHILVDDCSAPPFNYRTLWSELKIEISGRYFISLLREKLYH